MFHYLKSLPTQLILSILAAFVLGRFFDASTVVLFYTASSCFIEFLLFLLPLMVFVFIFSAIIRIKQRSLQLILFIFLGVTLSNAVALYTSFVFSSTFLPFVGLQHTPDFASRIKSTIEPLFSLHLPTLLSTDKAMLIAVISGVIISFVPEGNRVKKAAFSVITALFQAITFFLQKIFIPLLPFYVFGFCLKLSYDQALVYLFETYGKVFVISMLLLWVYIPVLYLIAARGNIKVAFNNIKTMAPAGLTGFSTMSSAATMPVTIKCTEETTKDRNFTDLVIPTTSNIHMLGDDLTIVMTSMALLIMFGHPLPDWWTFHLFAIGFCIAKLSCVGIPGASVLVVLPVLQNHLGFTPEMISALTTIYILQDPFGTSGNVMGNGALALLIQRFKLGARSKENIADATAPS